MQVSTKYKKMQSLLLIVSLFFSIFMHNCSISVLADNNQVEELPVKTVTNENDIEYFDYLEQFTTVEYIDDEILIKAAEYSCVENPVNKVATFAGKQNILAINGTGLTEWAVDVPKDGLYQVEISYCALAETVQDLEFEFLINGKIPFEEAKSITLPHVWRDQSEPFKDNRGNEICASQIQEETWQKKYLYDSEGLSTRPLCFFLKSGHNTLGIRLNVGKVAIESLTLSGQREVRAYSEYSREFLNDAAIYNGEDIVIQGEDAVYKSSKDLRASSDRTDPCVVPSSAAVGLLNYIGGSNWDHSGEKLIWNFNVKKTGWYAISFKYRQDTLTNSSVYRKLTIDNESLFKEAEAIPFSYDMNWQLKTLSSKEKPLLIYLTKGTHTLAMEVTLGPISEMSRKLEDVIYEVGEIYRTIIMITGTTPDVNRDYRLHEQIPDLMENLGYYHNQLLMIAEGYDALSGQKGGSQASSIRQLASVFANMMDSKFRMHEYVSNLYSSYSSAAAWVYEMRLMPMDLDAIILSSPDSDLSDKYMASFWEKLIFGFQSFALSFTGEYNNLYGGDDENAPTLTLWTTWGREQVQILNTMIKESFTPETGIQVSIKITGASLIQGILSNRAPDCSLMVARDVPVNLALRGALVDLSEFNDFSQVISRFASGSLDAYEYKGGIYGIPDTQSFSVMFVRSDVFDNLKLNPPATWEDFLQCSEVIMRNNMSIGIPNLFTSMLYQYGGTLYNEDKTQTTLMTSESISAFTYVSSLFKEYKFPVSYDFYNRFRTGEMPLGIAPFTEYARLMAAAPEIRGRWEMFPIPGIVQADGTIKNSVADTGTAAIILDTCKNKDSAWEFLKWWTEDSTQLRYASDIESVLGIVSRHSTSNLEAFSKLSWGKGLSSITSQRANVITLPETPGSYYLTRALDNAFYSTIYEGETGRDMLLYWSGMVDEEMKRKQQEYALLD